MYDSNAKQRGTKMRQHIVVEHQWKKIMHSQGEEKYPHKLCGEIARKYKRIAGNN